MSTGMRILFYGIIGIIGVLCAWPVLETLIYFQGGFGTLLLYSILVGAAVGLFLGGAFGVCEGIIQKSMKKFTGGLVAGLLIGAAGGVIGILAGQAASLFLGTSFATSISGLEDAGYPLVKALGWAIFGVFVGIVEGVRSKSLAKIRNGLFGGFLGGFLGGFVFELFIRLSILPPFLSRLAGLILTGFLIGIFYGFVENKLARAVLLALNGPSKGKEFLVTQNVTTIGGDEGAAVTIAGYAQIEPEHAVLRRKRNEITVQDKGTKSGTFVNDKKVTTTVVNDGDVIRVGDAQFLFRKK